MNAHRRRDYRHFPDSYPALLYRFDRDAHATLGPMPQRDARAVVRDLYRYKTFLSHALDTDPADDAARDLHRIAARLMIRVEPVATENGTDTHVIVLQVNPVTAAMEATP